MEISTERKDNYPQILRKRQYYTGGGKDVTIPFSSIDPKWDMKKVFVEDPCSALGSYLLFGRTDREWVFSETIDVFNWQEIIVDSGKSGPGRVTLKADSKFTASGPGLNGANPVDYTWNFEAVVSAQDEIFDFDPQKIGIRDSSGLAYKELITRLINITPFGKNFKMTFSGSSNISEKGICCCVKTSAIPSCKKKATK